MHEGHDYRWYIQCAEPTSLFQLAGDERWYGYYLHDLDEGVVQIGSAADAPGLKFWNSGQTEEAYLWGKYQTCGWRYSNSELQSGRPETQMDCGVLPAHYTLRWTEMWRPVWGLGGLTCASEAVAIHLVPEGSGACLRLLGDRLYPDCTVTVLADNLGVMWVAIELATLTTVLMVGIYRTHEALEAAWKYFILGSVGIALALFGTILVYMAARPVLGEGLYAMVWTVLVTKAAQFDPALLNVAFVFLLLGYGTKVGLAPLHAWLPDAHAEGPTPASAVLSGLLLNVALYAVVLGRGKGEKGVIRLSSYQKGNHVVIEVEDDGRGIDVDKVRRKAAEVGHIRAGECLSDRETLELLFLPGLSTVEQVSEISGRGVGMDVVRNNIEALSGMVDIESEIGHGTRVIITLPITLAIIKALLITAAGRSYAVPITSVQETLCLESKDMVTVERKEVMQLRDMTLPLLRLSRFFGTDKDEPSLECYYVIVVGLAEKRVGIVVDDLLGQQDIVIKPLGDTLKGVRGITGAADLGDRRTILVLDVSGIISEATRSGA